MSQATAESPMMRQWQTLKNRHPDCLLLFRMGDFYETFQEDARLAAQTLSLTLTSRSKAAGQDFPLAGFPFQKLEPYLARLVRAGIKVAVAEQFEEQKETGVAADKSLTRVQKPQKGLVEREVTRIVTAGTLTEAALLDERANNFLAALQMAPARRATEPALAGLAWVDLSTGEFKVAELHSDAIPDQLARLNPAECLLPDSDAQGDDRSASVIAAAASSTTVVSRWSALDFDLTRARREVQEHFGVHNLAGFDGEDLSVGLQAAGAILAYLRQTQMGALGNIVTLARVRPGTTMTMDRATIATLEITQKLREGGRDSTLLAVVDLTRTAMGARRMRSWLLEPLIEVAAILTRQQAVGAAVEADSARAQAIAALSRIQDIERLTARVTTGRASGRDLVALRDAARALPDLAHAVARLDSPVIAALAGDLGLLADLEADIAAILVDDPPATIKEGGMLRAGASVEFDEIRTLQESGDEWIARFQAAEIARTGIPSLKVGYNSVFGYYIEVTHANVERVPVEYVRKQTLKNAERYITQELKAYEDKVLSARERGNALELEIFESLRRRVAAQASVLARVASSVAELDALTAFAELARRHRWVRPQIDAGDVIQIEGGRHPVLDLVMDRGTFVPNDLLLGTPEQRVIILTGPNMAGKSTYIRQVALLVLLAQTGSFVPATSAQIGVVDRIFTRIGAADEISRGASTFMVEMNETASILNHATARSLVVLDEVGRGTSTYDGVSIAWAITEHLHDVVGARTLFATHYHELTELAGKLDSLTNANVLVAESGDDVVFLHKIAPGGADKSYGIHVARLAGIPRSVVHRATEILESLEERASNQLRARLARTRSTRQGLLFPVENLRQPESP